MNFGFFFLFLIIQVIVNNILAMFINTSNIFGLIAFYLLSCLIISFFGAFMSTPPGYKKDFYRHPGFHKTMLIYFVVFFALDLLMIFVF